MNGRVLAVALALTAATLAGCKSVPERLTEALQDTIANDSANATIICGFPVQGISGLSVTNVTNQGTSSAGTGTAMLMGTPMTYAGQAAPGPCNASITFRYDTVTTGRRTTYNSRGRRSTTRTTALSVWDMNVVNRGGAMPGMMPGMPAAPAMPQMPAAMTGSAMGLRGCAAYQNCCNAIAVTPGIAQMAASCAAITQYRSMGANGESICNTALQGLRNATGSMGRTPPACL